MKTGLTILILFASFLGFSQSSSDTLFTFDLNKYNRLKEQNLNHYFLEDSTKITFGETDGSSIYYMEISEFNSHFSSVFRYFKSTLTLEKSMEFFNRNKIGIEKEYDEQGNLLSAYNHDAVFIFSLQDLAKELHSNYNLDIMSFESAISVSIETSFKPLYNIAYPVRAEDSFGNWRFLQFDGITGEKLEDFEKAYECRSK
jgi:hypothetical protein